MNYIIKSILFTILAPGTVVGIIPSVLILQDMELYSFSIGSARFVGLVVMIIGAIFYFWSAFGFALIGKGTPAPIDPPKKLVVEGLYKIVRNPMYVGVILVLAGESMYFGSLTLIVYTFFMWLAFHLFIVLHEEPRLRGTFGTSYDRYYERVPRWIPKIP